MLELRASQLMVTALIEGPYKTCHKFFDRWDYPQNHKGKKLSSRLKKQKRLDPLWKKTEDTSQRYPWDLTTKSQAWIIYQASKTKYPNEKGRRYFFHRKQEWLKMFQAFLAFLGTQIRLQKVPSKYTSKFSASLCTQYIFVYEFALDNKI